MLGTVCAVLAESAIGVVALPQVTLAGNVRPDTSASVVLSMVLLMISVPGCSPVGLHRSVFCTTTVVVGVLMGTVFEGVKAVVQVGVWLVGHTFGGASGVSESVQLVP